MSESILNSKAAVTVAAILAGAVVLYFVAKKLGGAAGEIAAKVGNAVNPVSDTNVAYTGVNKVGQVLTGNDSWSLGSAIYDIFHPYDPNAPAKTNHLIANSDVDGRPSSLR